jgi:CheY-like chemotaxis protein/signal transduction histidine kinase
MRLSFRAKLLTIVGSAALAFFLIIVVSVVSAQRIMAQLTTIQNQYLPKVELEPKLEARFEALRRSFQDAVAAHDMDALARAGDLENALLEELDKARDIIGAGGAATLRTALEEYYSAAHDVSRRLIAGETGEPIVDAMALMQAKHARAAQLLKQTTSFDRSELTKAFAEAKHAEASATQARFAVVLTCLAFVMALSLWLSRGTLSSLEALVAGLERFGTGRFDTPIRVATRDELLDVAERANAMAASLERVDAERERSAWLKSGQAGIANELRGELDADDVAARAIGFVARHVDAPAAGLYVVDKKDRFRLVGRYARSAGGDGEHEGGAGAEGDAKREAAPSFGRGEGLVGQAALVDDITVIADPPAGYLRVRSGLGEAAPRALVFLPLVRDGKVTGVIELALFKPWSERSAEFLLSVRESIAIALEVARARTALRRLLAETQGQAFRLAGQEEELRATNEELQAQQEELRQINEELTTQATALEMQRHVLEEKNSELMLARARLEQKAEELTTVSAYKSQFLANMSHELRTPLNSMLLLSQLLAENETGNLTPKQVEFAKTVFGAGTDLLALINQVLDLAKVEAGKQAIRIEQVPLRELCDHARRVFGALAERKGLRFVVEVAPGLPETIATDRQRIGQILNNLLANAIKFTEQGEVALRIGAPARVAALGERLRRDGAIAFAVSDTGVGIAPEHQARVFVPFEQVEATADRRYGGTGLGLSIARELAQLLGGELQLTSAPGKGSTFVCYLPGEAREGPPAEALPAAPAFSSSSNDVKDDRALLRQGDSYLLVIEDDRVFAELLGEVIRDFGLRFVIERDGKSALRSAKERRPSGIILDVKLPDVDGWHIMEQLRADEALASIPVHFVSAVDGAERGIAMGAIGYLTKPASHRDLVRVVEALVPSRGDGSRRLLVVEDAAAADASLAHELRNEGVEIRRVSTARQVLALVAKERFGCMIIDLALPDMDGLELLASLEERCGADMPAVVVYTARPLSKDEAKRLEAYADAVILKDGSSNERLLDEIRLFLRRVKEGLGAKRAGSREPESTDGRLIGRRVLLVDDDMRTVYALSAALRAKGVDVLVADTGKAALAVLAERPDVEAILMDIMMPEMDGYEAMRQIRRDPRFATLPIIALTAKAMKGDAEKCIEAGASDYLPKPIDLARLLTMLRSRLAHGADVASGR